MNQHHTPAELNALRDSYANYIKSHAPEGVNLRTARKGESVYIYIMNAPAPLFDFSEYGDAVRCVELYKAAETNAEAAALLAGLVANTKEWSAANGGAILSARVFVGSPSQSFAPIAKNTPRAYNFDGFAVTCAPADLPVLFARYCKAFRVRYAAPVEVNAAPRC